MKRKPRSRRSRPTSERTERKAISTPGYPRRWLLAGLGIYIALALWKTWPVILSPFAQVPMGSETVASVPLYSTWAIWWNADRLAAGLQGYWDAPIFFPTPGAFALSEPQPTTMVVAPIIWMTGSRVLAYNVYVWLSLVLNGVFAQRLLKVYGTGDWMALWGGAAMVLLPVVIWQLGIIQLVPVWGILWTWAAMEQLCRQPTRRKGIELGIALGFSFITCMHHGLFHAILLIGASPTLWRQFRSVESWPYWLMAMLIALIMTGPFAYQIHQVVKQHRIERDQEIVTSLSALPGDYLQAYGGQLIEISPQERSWRMLSPGWIKVGLAIVGVVFGLKQAGSRRWSSFLLATTVLAFLLSLGPNLRVFSWQPWWSLAEYVPVFADVRTVLRFAFFVQMAVVIFAALGLYLLHQIYYGRLKRRWSRIALRSVLVVVALTALLEVRVRPGLYATMPDVNQHKVWLEYVRHHTPAGHAIACFPLAAGDGVADFQPTTEWMYLGSFHRVPIVNGYSTHFPRSYYLLRHELTTEFPSTEKLRRLVELNVKFLVLRRPVAENYSPTDYNVSLGEYWIKHVCADEKVDVFEVGGKTP